MAPRPKPRDFLAFWILMILTLKDVQAGVLAGAGITGDTDGYFILTSGGCGSCCAEITVETAGGGDFKVEQESVVKVGPVSVSSGSQTVNMDCTDFGSAPGIYAVDMTVTNGPDSFSKSMMAVLETALTGYTVTASQVVAPPYSTITFDMEVQQGSNALFTIDVVTNIQLMKSCDGTAKTASYSQMFNTTGSHTITTMASNYGTKLTEVVVINIVHNMNEVDVTITNIKPEPGQSPGIKVTMGAGAQTPMGTLTSWYVCNTGDASAVLDLSSLTPGGEVAVPCTCMDQGNRTVTVNVSTELDSIVESFDIYCWNILAVTLTLEKSVQPINTNIPFIVENLPEYGMTWDIDACQGHTVQNTDVNNYNSLYTANQLDLSSIQYTNTGNCTLQATFWNELYIVVLNLSFELAIGVTDLTAEPSAREILVGQSFQLTVNASGSDVFWAVDFTEAMVVQDGCSGMVAEHNFTTAGEYTIDVMASNKVNNMSTTVPLTVANPINGYTVTAPTPRVDANANLAIEAALSGSANVPMGNLTITITPCGSGAQRFPLPVNPGNTETFNCLFTVQGNYTLSVTIASQLSSENFTVDAYICDTLAMTTTLSKTTWAVNDEVDITLNTPPQAGFKYVVDYGDGNPEAKDETEAILLSPNAFTTIPSHQYTAPGTYTITFTGYNQCFSVTDSKEITVDFGIPDSFLQVTNETVVIPDDTVKFTIVMTGGVLTAPNPTAVTCTWDFGDGTSQTDQATTIDFSGNTGEGYEWTHTYTTAGTKAYSFQCQNSVSSFSSSGSLNVVEVVASAFTLSNEPVMSLATGSSINYEVTLAFHDVTTVPNGVTYKVDFGDGTGESVADPLTSFTVSKSLDTRGPYSGSLTVIYNTLENNLPFTFALGTCSLTLQGTTLEGLVGTTSFAFDVKNFLSGEAIDVDIDWKVDTAAERVNVAAGATTTVNHAFLTHGKKIPSFQSVNSKGTDSASLDKELDIMYPVQDLELDIQIPALLGVSVEPNIIYTGSNVLENLACIIRYDDATTENKADVTLQPSPNNIAVGDGYVYLVVQEETITVTCSNSLTSQTLNSTFEVSSDCFEAPDIFEPITRRIATPMNVYSSSLPTLTARVKLTDKCKNSTQFHFTWTFEKQNRDTSLFEPYTIKTENKISMNLATSTIDAGLYLIKLKMVLVGREDDYLQDKMYLNITDPPLVSQIFGGDFRRLGQGDILTLDANRSSYDPIIGPNGNSGLTFTWSCYVVDLCSDTDIYIQPKSTDTSYRSKTVCSLPSMGTDGNIDVDTSPLAFGKCYVFESSISKGARTGYDVQIVEVVEESPCDTAMRCFQNCMEKITPQEPTAFEAIIECEGATQEELNAASYQWNLYKFDFATSQYSLQPYDPDMFKRPLTDKIFELKPDYFKASENYKLEVTATAAGKPEGIAFQTLVTNVPPRGGTCSIAPTEVTCEGWMDEGIRNELDDVRDISEPVTLQVFQDGQSLARVDFSRRVGIASVDVKVGAKENNYVTEVQMTVSDKFKGLNTATTSVTVKNSAPVLPDITSTSTLNPEEQAAAKEAYTNFLEDAKSVANLSALNGAPEDTAVVVAAFASAIQDTALFDDIDNSDIAAVTNENFESEMEKTLTASTTENVIRQEIQSANEVFVSAIKTGVENELAQVASTGKVSPDSITLLSNSMTAIVARPDLLNENTVGMVGDVLTTLSSWMGTAANNSLSTNEGLNMQKAMTSFLSSVINMVNFYNVSGTNSDLTEKFENTTNDSGLNDVERNYLEGLLERKRKLKLKAATEQLKSTAKSIETAIDNLSKLGSQLTADDSVSTMTQDNVIQSVQKANASTVLTSANDVNGTTFEGEALEGVADGEPVQLNNAVMKNIFVTGELAQLAEHPVTMSSVTKNGKKVKVKGTLISHTDPLDQQNYVFYPDPTFTKDDPRPTLYHAFPYRSKYEQICVTVRPIDTDICYSVAMRAVIPPTDLEQDHYVANATGSNGFEYCAPALACKRIGECWLGLVPFKCKEPDVAAQSRRKRDTEEARERRAIADEVTSSLNNNGTNSTNELLSPYFLRIVTLSCLSWDGDKEDWDAGVCQVFHDTAVNKTKCKCGDREEAITTVSFFVAPNTIDFSTVFSKFDIAGQGAVLGTIIAVFVLFVILLFWARYMDGQDVLQWGVTLLADNYKKDNYFYLLTVHTGMVRHGGTKSKIGFCIAGEDDDTGVRILSDGVREELNAGSTMHFLLAVPNCLGPLQCFRIWHDNSGKGDTASWYLNRIEVTDLQNNFKYDFLCYAWLALEEGTLEKALAISSTENMKNFKTMFFEHARHHLTDDHLWVSVVLRPVKSHFSRVQRIGCCYVLLMLAMISNAMFFQSNSNKNRVVKADFTIGPIKFNLSQIYISFISAVITAVPVFFIMLLFRKSKLSMKATKDGARLWMPRCFRNFKFYKQSKAIEKIMVIRDIVDDQDGVLPHFCVYIAWVFGLVCVVVSAFFIMLYSMEWGKEISEEWLVTFILSFFESLIIMDPVKVLVLAILFAILLKTLKASKPSHFDLTHIRRMVHEHGVQGEGRERLDYRSPFSEEELQKAKLKCQRRNTMRKAILELLVNSFFLWLLASICYSNRDPHGFALHQNIKNMYLEPFRPAVTFAKVNSTEHYFFWLQETIIPQLFPLIDFNGSNLTPNLRLRTADLSNFRVGAPRLRQLRQPQVQCNLPYIGRTTCYPSYSMASEETKTWCQGWKSHPPCSDQEALAVTNQAWTFVSPFDIWGLPISGQLGLYGGGGYIAELDISRQVALMTYDELVKHRWVDRNTRAVFLEFTLYNVNVNLFAYVSLLAEFPDSGGVHEFTNIYPFRSFTHVGPVGMYTLVCEIIFFIFTFLWLGYILFRLMKERWTFFKGFWNVVELTSVIASFMAVILYFIRLSYTNDAMGRFKENNRIFINFYHIAVWDSVFVCVLGFLLGIATIRLLKVMGYSKVTQIVYLVLKESSKTLPGFFFYIMLILSAYGLLGYIIFGKSAYNYKDPITTIETLFSGVLGHAGFRNTNLPAGEQWITLAYFVSFILIVVFCLSNIFMTILLDTMSLVGDDPKNLNYKEIELFAYLWDSAKTLVTGKKENRGLDTSKGGPTLDDDLHDDVDKTFTFGGIDLLGGDDRKMQMKMKLAAAMKLTGKPSYKY